MTAVCQRGHVMDEANTYTRPGNGRHACRTCRKLSRTWKKEPEPPRPIRPLEADYDWVIADRIIAGLPVTIPAGHKGMYARALYDQGWGRNRIAIALHASNTSMRAYLHLDDKKAA